MGYDLEPDHLLGGYCIMLGLVITILDLMLIKVIAKNPRNIFTKLLLGLIYCDTLQCIIVIFPFSINQWTGGVVLSGQLCAVTGLVNYIGEKVSAVLILLLGLCRYGHLKNYNSIIPDSVVYKLLSATFMFILLTSGLPFVTSGGKYQYNVVTRMCVWLGDDTGRKLAEVYLRSVLSQSDPTLDLPTLLSLTIPHTILTACIAYLTYISTPYIIGHHPRPIFTLQAITSTATERKPRKPRAPRVTHVTAIPSEQQSLTDLPGKLPHIRLNHETLKLTLNRSNSVDCENGYGGDFDNGGVDNGDAESLAESIQLTLAVEHQELNYSVSKTIYLLMSMYTALNIPRYTILLVDYILRVGWEIYVHHIIILVAYSVGNFTRIVFTSVILWWRITSIRHLILQD